MGVGEGVCKGSKVEYIFNREYEMLLSPLFFPLQVNGSTACPTCPFVCFERAGGVI